MPRTLMIQGLLASGQAKLAAANFLLLACRLIGGRKFRGQRLSWPRPTSSCLLLHVKRETGFSRPACRHCGAGRNPSPACFSRIQRAPAASCQAILMSSFEPSRNRNRRPSVDESDGRWRPLSGLVRSARRLELVKIVGRGLRLGGGGDDGALVVLQDGEPTCQVGGGVIARIMSHAEIGAKE